MVRLPGASSCEIYDFVGQLHPIHAIREPYLNSIQGKIVGVTLDHLTRAYLFLHNHVLPEELACDAKLLETHLYVFLPHDACVILYHARLMYDERGRHRTYLSPWEMERKRDYLF